jgi:hypothetical protein
MRDSIFKLGHLPVIFRIYIMRGHFGDNDCARISRNQLMTVQESRYVEEVELPRIMVCRFEVLRSGQRVFRLNPLHTGIA